MLLPAPLHQRVDGVGLAHLPIVGAQALPSLAPEATDAGVRRVVVEVCLRWFELVELLHVDVFGSLC